MSNTGWMIARVLFVVAAAALPCMGCKSSPNAMEAAAQTARHWREDPYVPPTDPSNTSKNAARILTEPERKAQRTMQVGSSLVVMHERASVTSRAVATLKAGDAVKVVAEASSIRIPGTADMSEYIGEGAGDITPTWAKVSAGGKEGWVPARSLFSPLGLATSSTALSASRAAGAAGKGFSDEVAVRTKTLKGVAGTPQIDGANYKAADEAIARASQPLNFADPGSPWKPVARLKAPPGVGQPLKTVDAAMAVQAAEAAAKASQPGDLSQGMDAAGQVAGLLGGLVPGAGQATRVVNDPNVKAGAEALAMVEQLSREYPVTPVEERVLGRECLAVLIGKRKVLPESDPVACYVRWLGTRVAANSTAQYPSLGLDFLVIDDAKTVNAVAVPGGPVVITTGMLKFLQSEDELAVILGHEIAHVEERHGMKIAVDKGMDKWPTLLSFAEMQAGKQFDRWLAAALAKARVPDAAAKSLAPAVTQELTKALDQSFKEVVLGVVDGLSKGADQGAETGADLRGMSLASAAGYDPWALDAALERLKGMTGGYGGANYDEKRAELARSVVGLLPPVKGAPAAQAKAAAGKSASKPATAKPEPKAAAAPASANAESSAPTHQVKPSKEASDRWNYIREQLKRKS